MHVFEAIEKRRSVKHFDPEHKMTEDEIKRLIELIKLSPTAFNIQNWRFVIVKDAELREKMREAAFGQAQVEQASLLIVLCADLKAFAKEPKRYYASAPPEIQEKMAAYIMKAYEGQEQLQRDEAMRSTGIAGQTIMLAAKGLGYDSGALVGFDFQKVAEIIRLPKDYVVSYLIVVGKKLYEPRPRGGFIPDEEMFFIDHF